MESFESEQVLDEIFKKMEAAWWAYQDKWNLKPNLVFVSQQNRLKISCDKFKNCKILIVREDISDDGLFFESEDLNNYLDNDWEEGVIKKYSSAVSKNLDLTIPDSVLISYQYHLDKDK